MKKGEEAGIHRSSWHSECSTDVHESLVACGKPLQLVFGDGVDKCLELDIAKCRRWALEKAQSPLPIVTITDCILPIDESQLAQAYRRRLGGSDELRESLRVSWTAVVSPRACAVDC